MGGRVKRDIPEQVDARLVRHYLAELTGQSKADKNLRAHARAIRTLFRFWYIEHYIPFPVSFAMPRFGKETPSLLDG
jgi:site-specific recombinase XerD